MRSGVSVKVKNPGEKRPTIETSAVPDFNRDRAKLVHREQIIDRENDRYFERVTDYENGEIIHECEEPLSKHVDRGSAKKKRES